MGYFTNPFKKNPPISGQGGLITTTIGSSGASGNYYPVVSNAANGNVTLGGHVIFNPTTGHLTACGNSANKPKIEYPAEWRTVKRHCNQSVLDGGDDVMLSPVNGRQAWVADLNISNPMGRHHWSVFRKLFPEIRFLTAGVCETDHGPVVSVSSAIFLNEQDFITFSEWMEEYLTGFETLEKLYSYRVPPPPTEMSYSIQLRVEPDLDLVDFVVWAFRNCEKRVHLLGDILFFLSAEDASLYRLKFMGAK